LVWRSRYDFLSGKIMTSHTPWFMSAALSVLLERSQHLSLDARVLLEALVLTGGELGSAEQVADALHFRSRFQLARRLRREGLPPLHEIADWIRVMHWVDEWEEQGTALCRQAVRAGRDPSVCYRLVRRMTGIDWRDVRRRGSTWIAERVVSELASRP